LHRGCIKIYSIFENVKVAKTSINSFKSAAEVILVAVTKQVDISKTEEVILAGIKDIGENRVEPAKAKIDMLRAKYPSVSWHFIGHLQRKKVKQVVELFDLIHSVDREELIEKIIKEASEQNKKQRILLQVNIAKEEQKQGFEADEIENIVKLYQNNEYIIIDGLMMMAPLIDSKETAPYFRELKKLHESLITKGYKIGQVLSMGMSNDYIEAVKAGSTMVRLGTVLFNPLPKGEGGREAAG